MQDIQQQARAAVQELIEKAGLQRGDILVIGCSSSEVAGERIGTHSSVEVAAAIVDGICPVLQEAGVAIAAQCCEHLNRALIVEADVAKANGWPAVNVRPMPKAGGSFATTVYDRLNEPVAVEHIRAQAGLDIGGTLIGMHLQDVAVPVRLSIDRIGNAMILCARTRPKFIGGARAHYVEELL